MRKRQRNGKKLLKILFVWFAFITYIVIIEPLSLLSFLGFYLLLAISLFYTLKSFFSLGKSITWGGILLIYLFLRQLHLDNILNTIILAGIFVTFEIYFRKT